MEFSCPTRWRPRQGKAVVKQAFPFGQRNHSIVAEQKASVIPIDMIGYLRNKV